MRTPLRILAAGVVGLAFVSVAHGAGSNTRVPAYHNPVFAKDFPDPMVLRLNAHSYYAYGTATSWDFKGYFPVLHSTDLVHWKWVGDMFKIPPANLFNDMWAPNVVKVGKTYYDYFTGRGNGPHCIGVATSTKPASGFSHSKVLACGDSYGTGYIDPNVYVAGKGKAYLYVSVDDPQHNISVIPLKSNMRAIAGPRQKLFGLTQDWEHGANFSTTEGPFLIKHGALYYLFFSGNDWNGNYAMGYATATSPTGPFTPYAGNPILKGDAHVHGPGGGSVVEGPDGNLWMVYHGWPGAEGYDNGGIRNMRIDPITWNGDVASVTVTP